MSREYLCGYKRLRGHTKYVTAIATATAADIFVSSSRDKSLIAWTLNNEDHTYRVADRLSHSAQNIALSSDGRIALYASSKGKVNRWDLHTGSTARRAFVGHTDDVLSVSFSPDDRRIVSASRDQTIRLWNASGGECESTIRDYGVSCARFSPDNKTVVSGGSDRTVKVWDLSNRKARRILAGHDAAVKNVAVAPDGSMCASSAEDNEIILWDLLEGERLFSLKSLDSVNSICFSPCRYWVCAATDNGLTIWDLDNKCNVGVYDPIFPQSCELDLTSLDWSADGSTLYSGVTSGDVHVFQVKVDSNYGEYSDLSDSDDTYSVIDEFSDSEDSDSNMS